MYIIGLLSIDMPIIISDKDYINQQFQILGLYMERLGKYEDEKLI